ncbi:MAG TPA: hypothetical protein VFQ35_06260 [Polyangiaceae bacterium]|nr:hypothetical protein [Polyangiaceae bacterium]
MMRFRRALLGVAVVWGSFAACGPTEPDGEDYSATRLLDRACANEACSLRGDVRKIQGLTSDSLAYELGPGAATLSIPVQSELEPLEANWGALALVKGHGTLGGFLLKKDYSWQSIALDVKTGTAHVDVTEGSQVTVADVRIVRHYPTPNCE